MSEPCTCNVSPERCAASVDEHVRSACASLVYMAGLYDLNVSLTPQQIASTDQAAATYRTVLRRLGTVPTSRECVGILATSSITPLQVMWAIPGGQCPAAAAAKILVMSVPLIEELARG